MKVIVAGCRHIDDYNLVEKAIEESGFVISSIVCGMAKGIDTNGLEYAYDNKLPCIHFNARWDKFGLSAGLIRNKEMGDYADALIAVWDGQSPGTKHMISYMRKLNKPVFIKGCKEYVPEIEPTLLQFFS